MYSIDSNNGKAQMLASWIALIVLFLINGLNLHGDLTIKPTTLGLFYIVAAVVIVVDIAYSHGWFRR